MGSEGGTRGWKLSGISEQEYYDLLSRYDAELRKDSYVLGAAVFTGGPTADWAYFDTDPIVSYLVSGTSPGPEPGPSPGPGPGPSPEPVPVSVSSDKTLVALGLGAAAVMVLAMSSEGGAAAPMALPRQFFMPKRESDDGGALLLLALAGGGAFVAWKMGWLDQLRSRIQQLAPA